MADDNVFGMELVTPERVLFLGAATQVVLRTADGDLTFLNGHTPLVGAVLPGVVRITDAEGTEIRAAVHGGFVQVEKVTASGTAPTSSPSRPAPEPGGAPDASVPGSGLGTRVSLLAGVAELAGDVDVERARLAAERAEALVAELASSGRTASGGAASDEPGAGDGEGAVELSEAEAALVRARVRLEAVEDAAPG